MQLILISIVFGVACAWEIKPISSIGERPTGLWPRGGAVELNKLKPEEIKGSLLIINISDFFKQKGR